MEQSKRSFTETQFTVPWGHIAAKVCGSSKQAHVLMVHGSLDNSGSFDRLLEYLPIEFQYVCIDLPGHGFSTAFPTGIPLNFYNYVYCLKLVLDSLKWDSCIYIGHSLGAQLGVFLSIMYPGRITKLIVLDGILGYSTELDELIPKLNEYNDLDSYAGDSNHTYTKEEIMYALQFRRHSVLNTAAAEALFHRAVTKVGENQYRYNRDTRLRKPVISFLSVEQHIAVLQKVSIPILLILQDSPYRQLILRYIETQNGKRRKLSNLSIIPANGNHDNHNNYPESIAPHICAFLQGKLNSKL